MRRSLMLLPLVAAGLLYAEDASQQQLKIREMIRAVQEAPQGERYRRMNEFKQMIRSMNTEKRTEAIAQMKKAMQDKTETQTQSKAQTRTQTRTEEGEGDMIRTRQRQQMQTQQQMQQRNRMNSQQQLNRVTNPAPRITPQVPPTTPGGPGGKSGNRP